MKRIFEADLFRLLLGVFIVCMSVADTLASDGITNTAISQQQQRTLRGKVIDKNSSEPIAGASVWIKETTIGTTTDAEGNYTLRCPQGNVILAVSYIGYSTQEVVVGNENEINFQMEESIEKIEEVMVVGYTSQRKESVIGAITTIRVDELKQPVGQISNSLAGRLAGVIAVQRSGEPGQSSEFWIRGISTFGANRNPLVLVDGVERSLDLLDPEDIESFSILKDATATAVYGVRGANGVVIVNTRRGKEGSPNINVKVQSGILAPTKIPKMANSATWAEMYNLARTSHGTTPLYTEEEIRKYREHSDPYLYPDVDWLGELMNDYTMQQRVNLNVTGGGSIARYYVSGAFYNEGGLFITDKEHEWNTDINYKRYNFTSNVDVNLHPTTVIKLNMSGSMETKHQPYNSTEQIFIDAISTSPNAMPMYYPDRNEDGLIRYAAYGEAVPNPYNVLTQSGYQQNWWTKINAMMALEQDFSRLVTEGLKAEIKYSFDSNTWNQILRIGYPHTYQARQRDVQGNLVYEEKDLGANTLGYTAYATGGRALYLEGRITYDRLFGGNRVGALLLYNQRDFQESSGSSIGSLPYRSQGLAWRVTYSYDDRYFIEGNFGYNGSENFASGHRFGFFPAGAVGWLVTKENFMSDYSEIIDVLKLKASIGQSGNDQIGGGRRFVYLPTVVGSPGSYWGISNTYVYGTRVGEYANENVSWEVSTKANVGIELSLIHSLRLQVDYFFERREGIFVQRQSIPDYVGVMTMPWSNVGKMQNRGIDGMLEFDKSLGEFFISARANFTFARNKQIDNDQPDYVDKYRNRNGQKYGQQFGLVALGLFHDETEIANSPSQFGVSYLKPGDIKYKDINGDGVVDNADEVPIGYSNVPEIVYGFGTSMSYRGVDLSLFLQGIDRTTFFIGGAYFPFNYPNIGRTGFLDGLGDKYFDPVKQNFDAEIPLPYHEGWHGSNYQNSTYWQRSGAFLRLKNAEIGYTLPKSLSKNLNLKTIRFFLSGTNLLTFSRDVKLWDPEINSVDGRGYPLMRTVNLGININF
jgi:TonB-linked SusC/RagA family outer membrane protein